ncbi:hypothetical protein LEP1GSC017_2127 [Leptospira meyeri serovar Hardjo str. Went 5]|nr:hypothetical protein LEP1GSC017_2127 [Leptospira meyeri serovar Hardjo str. Went 5]
MGRLALDSISKLKSGRDQAFRVNLRFRSDFHCNPWRKEGRIVLKDQPFTYIFG